MRILLIGNGFDLQFSNIFNKYWLIKFLENFFNNLELPFISSVLSDKIKEYNYMQNVFFDENEKSAIIKSLDRNLDENSVEDIFILLNEIIDQNKRNKLYRLFEFYFEIGEKIILKKINDDPNTFNSNDSNEISYANYIKNKLSKYDLIITTNYTSVISCFLNDDVKNKIIYIHGKLNDKIYPILLGEDIKKNENFYVQKIFKYFDEQYISNKTDLISLNDNCIIDISIFGMSFSNDDNLLLKFIQSYFYNKYLEYYNNRFLMNWEQEQILIKESNKSEYVTNYCEKNFKLNVEYFYYSDIDNYNIKKIDKKIVIWYGYIKNKLLIGIDDWTRKKLFNDILNREEIQLENSMKFKTFCFKKFYSRYKEVVIESKLNLVE